MTAKQETLGLMTLQTSKLLHVLDQAKRFHKSLDDLNETTLWKKDMKTKLEERIGALSKAVGALVTKRHEKIGI